MRVSQGTGIGGNDVSKGAALQARKMRGTETRKKKRARFDDVSYFCAHFDTLVSETIVTARPTIQTRKGRRAAHPGTYNDSEYC